MQALRRISLKNRILQLSPATSSIKHSIPTCSKSLFSSSSPLKTRDEEQKESPSISNETSSILLAAAAAASLTPAGYSIPAVGVTVLSNLPLAAFALVQASGIAPIRQIVKDKDTGDFSPFPFISLFTNCAIWSLYGMLQQDQTILIANIAGTVVGLVYTGIFAANTTNSMMKYYVGSSAILGTFLTSPFWAPTMGMDAATILGTFGMTTAVVLMASPLAVVGTVIRNKSTASMPFIVSLAMTLNGATWGAYGWFVTSDQYVYLPNILGCAA
eukprot:46440_1